MKAVADVVPEETDTMANNFTDRLGHSFYGRGYNRRRDYPEGELGMQDRGTIAGLFAVDYL